MTGPAPRGTERGTRAPTLLTGTLGAVGAVLVVLALGLVLRLIIARLLPGSGFDVDLSAFRFWASNLASQGLDGFYDRDFFHDYTPGYLYVLWLVGIVGQMVGGIGDLIKVPPILADLAIGWLAWSMVRELGGRDRLALAAAAVAVLNPISWFDSVVWGQADSFGVVFVLLGLRELWRDRPERAAIFTVIAAIIKPQLGILIPLVAVVTIRRALWPAGGFGDTERTGRPIRILTTGLAGFLTAVALSFPFGLSVIEFSTQAPYISSGLLEQVAVAAGGYPYLTVNAYNPWALVPGDLGYSLANAGLWVCDYAGTATDCGSGTAVFGGIPAVLIGTTLLLAAIGLVLWVIARRPDRLTLLVGLAVLALAFFAVPTRVHERYGYPFFAMGVILAAVSVRWRVAYVVLSVATFANMYVVLTTLYPNNPSIDDWLGIGPAIRSEAGVIVVSLLHAAAFVWAFVQLRTGARERLEREMAAASADTAGSVVDGAPAAPGARRAGPVGVPYGGLGDRAIAYIVDTVLVGMVGAGIAAVLAQAGLAPLTTDPETLEVSANTLGMLVSVAAGVAISAGYFISTWTRLGGTPGMKLMSLRIGTVDDDRPPTIDQAVRRWVVLVGPYLLASVLFGVSVPGFLVATTFSAGWFAFLAYTTATSPTRQGFHDTVAHTMVLRDTGAWAAQAPPPVVAAATVAPTPARTAATGGTGAKSTGTLATTATATTATAPRAAATGFTMPSWTPRPTFEDVGILGWFKARLSDIPIRPDRSAGLRGEGGGRLDRLDLFLIVLLVVATMLLRTFRLAEPYQMHFDEVYHARTATEFLQYWRYGLTHQIYEWTHPHLAKYLMAGGIVLWGEDDVKATSELEVPVRSAAVEPRRLDESASGYRAGERVHVATGTEIRSYDLKTRALVSIVAAPGASALTVDESANQLVIGYEDGRIATLELTAIGDGGVDIGLQPADLARVDHPVEQVLVTNDGAYVVAASADRLSSVDVSDGSVVGSLDLPDIADLAPGGSGTALVATVDEVTDPAAVASSLAEILSTDAADYERRLAEASPGTTVVLGDAGSGDARTALDAAIADGTLPGVRVDTVARTAVATATGVVFVDPERASVVTTIPLANGAHGLALVTGIDDTKLYATSGDTAKPTYDVITVGGDSAKDGPVAQGSNALPGLGSSIEYDEASQQVHILGLAPGATTAGPWTVYVVEPHGNAVYADARLPDGFDPVSMVADFNGAYPSSDRQQLLLFDGSGTSVSVDAGSHAFAWRFPGVIAGALTAALLYLLARILFKRRIVAGLLGLFVLVDGMFFVQSRIGMNDVYVGLFIIAAYTVFAAVWTGWWRGRAAFWLAMPAIGALLGLALASKWVAAYAIGALLLLILVRSALGRILAIIGLIGITGVLGYMAISPTAAQGGADPGFGNLTFLTIMVALTLLAVVVNVLHPIAWTDEEQWFAIGVPVALGALVFFGALALGRLDAMVTVGPLAVTPLLVAIALATGSLVVAGLFWLAGRWGFGPLAVPPALDDPVRLLEPPAAPPEAWLRPGWLFGLPVVWMAICLLAVPIAVYVVSYIPWAFVENPPNQIVTGWPPGHTGQTLLDLTMQMYNYHNTLTAAHPASSPWWAWPMNLKPVWFYQEGLAAGTSAALYDAGSLVIWWMGIPAIAFVSWMAFKRRSLALALIAIGFAAQWIPWARIDRAAFQYHYYTALPFVVLALAYFAAELWNGASRHAWTLARAAAAIAIMAPALLWIFHRPLCALVGVESVNPGSQACPAVIPQFVLTVRTAALALTVGIGLILVVWRFLAFQSTDGEDRGDDRLTAAFWSLVGTGIAVAVAMVVASFLPETTILTVTNIPVEPIAIVIAIPLGYLGLQIVSSRDARRFVVGLGVAAVMWFAILYPNISALPLPSAVVAAYQGILPTYLYAFQFPVSTVTRSGNTPLFTPMLGALLVGLTVTCLVFAYSAWVWRLALAEAAAARSGASGTSDDAEGLARSGGA